MRIMNSNHRRLIAGTLAAGILAAGACLLLSSVCAAQTPEQQKMWDAQRAQAQAVEKVRAEKLAAERAARKADPMAWVRTLNPLAAGGWQFRSVAPDGSWASFSTEHQLKRSGHLVTAWLREEYPEPQRSESGSVYLSYVEKIQYDCANERARALMIIYYSENSLTGSEESETTDVKQAAWVPIVPGTPSEDIYEWACRAANLHNK